MRVAVLADVHGNLPACEAVLEDIGRMSPDYIVAAGDLALRGPYPKETLDLLFDRCAAILMGNTDCYLAGSYLGGAYRDPEHWKAQLLAWTRDQIGQPRLAQLGELPFAVRYSPRRGNDLYVCHANPRNLEDSIDPTLDESVVRQFLQNLEAAACAFGHLHFPYRRRVGRMVIADVASAGLPRDGDLRAAYGLFTFTPKGWRVQIRRVRYAVRKVTQAIAARRVPGGPLLVHKLLEARYRHHNSLLQAARRHSGLPPARSGGWAPGIGAGRPPRPAAIPEIPEAPSLSPAELALDTEDSIQDGPPLSLQALDAAAAEQAPQSPHTIGEQFDFDDSADGVPPLSAASDDSDETGHNGAPM